MSVLTEDLQKKIKYRKDKIEELTSEILVRQDTIRVFSKEIDEFEKILKVLKP